MLHTYHRNIFYASLDKPFFLWMMAPINLRGKHMGYDIYAHLGHAPHSWDEPEEQDGEDETAEDEFYGINGTNVLLNGRVIICCPDDESAHAVWLYLLGEGPMPDPTEVNRRILAKAFHNDPKVK